MWNRTCNLKTYFDILLCETDPVILKQSQGYHKRYDLVKSDRDFKQLQFEQSYLN